MATNVTLPDERALRAVARYEREHHKGVVPQKPTPRPPRKPIIRPPHFEPGTKPEEKVAMLLAAGFVQVGTTPGGNPLFRHPENPEGYAPFELFTKKRSFERAPAERPRKSAQEMVNLLSQRKATPVRVTANGDVVTARKIEHNGSAKRKLHLTPKQLAQRKADQLKARAAKKAAGKQKKEEDAKSSKNGKNKNGAQKKK